MLSEQPYTTYHPDGTVAMHTLFTCSSLDTTLRAKVRTNEEWELVPEYRESWSMQKDEGQRQVLDAVVSWRYGACTNGGSLFGCSVLCMNRPISRFCFQGHRARMCVPPPWQT